MELLYNHRTIPEEWTCVFQQRKSPDYPENISNHKRDTETTDSAFLDQEQSKRRAKTKKDTHTPVIKNIYTGKNQESTLVLAPKVHVFSKLYF